MALLTISAATRSSRGIFSWLDAAPHPPTAVEISSQHVAAAAWSGSRLGPGGLGMEPLPAGAVVPSPVELNVADPSAVSAALERVVNRVGARGHAVALLIPDPAVRVFILQFESFPPRAEEAVQLLRWRLKKSVPFDVEETCVSYVLQPAANGVEVVAAVARQRIVRQYEQLLETAGLHAGVVLGSTLAVLPLVDEDRPTLLARVAGTTLTTAVVRGDRLCVFRCTELSSANGQLEPSALLEEIFPALAFFQDSWKENVQLVRLAGLGARAHEFRSILEHELGCSVAPLASAFASDERLTSDAKNLLDRQLDALVGWMMNRGA